MYFKNLGVKDHFLSKESFTLKYDPNLDMLITEPKPSNLDAYYESNNYISHTDNTFSLIDKIYALIKSFTLRRKVRLINEYAKNERTLLDVGAGTGDFLKEAQQDGWSVDGVEPNESAQLKAKTKKLKLKNHLNEVVNQFDVITLWHVLEHLPDLEKDISGIVSKLNQNGTLIIAVPNFKSYDASFYQEYWAAFDVPRHLWHFSKRSITHIFSKYNLQLVKVKPMYFDSFYVSILSEKYKHGKSNLIKAAMVGLWSNIKGVFTKEYSSHIYILKKD